MKSIGGPNRSATTGTSATGNSSKSGASGSASSSNDSADALRVGTEFITPVDLWRFEKTHLIETTRTMDALALRNFLEQESARLVRDTTTERLLYQKAAERITPQMEKSIDGYVDAELRKITTEEFGGVQRRYERDLRTKGLTLDEVRGRMRREIIIAGYLDANVKPKVVEPSRADLMMAYEAYQRQNERPQRRRMSLIDVRVANRLADDVTDPTAAEMTRARDDARSRIESAAAAIRNGTAFNEAARTYSDGLHAAEGGSWGWITPGSVRVRFEPAVDVLYRLQQEQVSDVIESSDGFFLVRCDEIDGGGTPDFVTLQPELKERFYRNMFNDLVADLVEELRQKARIDPADLDKLWQATVREGLRIVLDARQGPPTP